MSAAVDGDGPRSRSPSRSESDLSDRSNGSSYTGSTYGSTVSRQSSSDGDRGDDSGVKGRQGDGRSDSADQARTNGTAAAPAAANGHANGSAAPAPAAPRPVPPVKGKKGLKPQGSKWFFEDGQVGQVMTTPPSSARLNGHSGAAGGDSQAAEAASGRGGQSRWSSLLGQVSRKGRSGAKGATAATDSLDSTAQSEGDGASASVATDRGGQTAQSSAASLSSTEGLGGDQLTGGPDRMTSMPALRTGEAPSSAAGVLPSTSPGRAAKNLSATLARASNAHSDSEEEEEEEKGVDDVSARSGSVTPSSYSDSASRSTGTYSSRSRSYSHSHSTGSVTPRSHSRSASHSGGEGPAEPEAVRENRASSQEEVVQQQQHEGEQEPGAVPQAPRESSPTEGHSEDEASSRGHARSPPLRTSAYGDTHYPGFEDGIYESFVQPMAGSVRRVYPPAHRPVSRGLDEPASGAEETGPDDAIAWVMDGPDSAELDADKPPPGREEVDKEGYPLYSRHYMCVPAPRPTPDPRALARATRCLSQPRPCSRACVPLQHRADAVRAPGLFPAQTEGEVNREGARGGGGRYAVLLRHGRGRHHRGAGGACGRALRARGTRVVGGEGGGGRREGERWRGSVPRA